MDAYTRTMGNNATDHQQQQQHQYQHQQNQHSFNLVSRMRRFLVIWTSFSARLLKQLKLMKANSGASKWHHISGRQRCPKAVTALVRSEN